MRHETTCEMFLPSRRINRMVSIASRCLFASLPRSYSRIGTQSHTAHVNLLPRLNIIYIWRRHRRRWVLNAKVHPRCLPTIIIASASHLPEARCAMNCPEMHTQLSFSDRACRAVEDPFRCLPGGRRRSFRVADVASSPVTPGPGVAYFAPRICCVWSAKPVGQPTRCPSAFSVRR